MPGSSALIVVNSRLKSNRIPNKALKLIAGKPALQHILDRVQPTGFPCVVAVPGEDATTYAEALRVRPNQKIMRIDVESPLHRTLLAVRLFEEQNKTKINHVVRITNDDLIIDAITLEGLVASAQNGNVGYAITPSIVNGAGVEVIATENIKAAVERHPAEIIEHISYYVKGECQPNPSMLIAEPRKSIKRNYRLTMDYPEDVVVIDTLLRVVGPDATVDRMCQYLDQNSWLLKYNALPEATVYTCARNAERWIRQTMMSVLGLDGDFEYIVIDDQSTDNTPEQILAVSCVNDTYPKVILNERNVGLASSCNIALSHAKGRYIVRVDGDDMIDPSALDRMIEVAGQEGAAIVYAGYREVGPDGELLKQYVEPDVHHHAGCALMDSKILNQLRFKEGLRHWDGLELFNRVKANKFPIAYIREPLWTYRQHGESMSKNDLGERAEVRKEIEQ